MRENFDLLFIGVVVSIAALSVVEWVRDNDRIDALVAAELHQRGKVSKPNYRRDEYGNCMYVGARGNMVSVSCDNIPESQIVGINEIESIRSNVK